MLTPEYISPDGLYQRCQDLLEKQQFHVIKLIPTAVLLEKLKKLSNDMFLFLQNKTADGGYPKYESREETTYCVFPVGSYTVIDKKSVLLDTVPAFDLPLVTLETIGYSPLRLYRVKEGQYFYETFIG
jgi:hypothetical protein